MIILSLSIGFVIYNFSRGSNLSSRVSIRTGSAVWLAQLVHHNLLILIGQFWRPVSNIHVVLSKKCPLLWPNLYFIQNIKLKQTMENHCEIAIRIKSAM